MKSKASKLVPIVLALLLPTLGYLYDGSMEERPVSLPFPSGWLISSVLFYTYWHLITLFWRIPWAKGRVLSYFLRGLFWVGIYGLFLGLFTAMGKENPPLVALRMFMGGLMNLSIQYGIRSQEKLLALQEKHRLAQRENYRAQLSTIRAKIDPHFLFNTLNVLRSMVRQRDPNSEDFVVRLSQFYRQTLSYTEDSTIKLSQEMEVLEAYLFLMSNRNADAFTVDTNIATEHLDWMIPTLSLQLVIENCFKHNAMSASRPLFIEIASTPDGKLSIRNNIQPKFSTDESPGFGLKSLAKRYELMDLPGGLSYGQKNGTFELELQLIAP